MFHRFPCCLVFLLMLLLVTLNVSPLDGVRTRCKHPQKRIREDHIHYCCKHPDGHNDITEECARQTNFRLPSPQEEAVEDLTVPAVMQGICWGECVFKRFGFWKPGRELDMTAVRSYYSKTHGDDPEYEREMIAAFDHCHGEAEKDTADLITIMSNFNEKSTCHPTPSVILSCVIYNFFHNCPKDRWANTTECEETRQFAKQCKNALATI